MDIKDAEKLQKLWDNKPCEHLYFEAETIKVDYVGRKKTNDFICTQCGTVFTYEEMKKIKESHKK
ncbi:hypothetical protein HMPREF1214_03955 [Bacteroides sp. HPS0048]|uniref:hypothetical protein n=1 Tax=Bacteroides sp. HPS0048 TaxID=1078089 RepID=UPI00035D8866|nr:hypothetical protein [Bacteroides sp. HPS0048]EOA55171.1 hypothetical protein HMPREF1214_03955 [Bacteroides sp. HPS0048]